MKYYEILKSTPMFSELSEFECQAMMFCFKTKFKTFLKGEIIIKQGEAMDYVVLILKGSANVQHIDVMGNIVILMKLRAGELYGVESAYANVENNKDNVILVMSDAWIALH